MPWSVPLLLCALFVVSSAPGASARPIDSPPFGLPSGDGRPFDLDPPVVDAPPFGLPGGGGRPFDFETPVVDAPPFGLPSGGGRPFDFETPVVDAPPFGLPGGGGRPFDFETPFDDAPPFGLPALSIDSLAATAPIAGAGGLAQVPEPASAILLGLGVVALALCRRASGAQP